MRKRSHQRATPQFVLTTACACAQQVFSARSDSIPARAAGLALVRCLEPLPPSALRGGASGLPLAWVGVLDSGAPVPHVPGWAEDVEVHPGTLPGLGNERLDPLHLLLLLLQLLGAQGSIRLQVNVPFGDEDFVWCGELGRDLGHHLRSVPSPRLPPGFLPLCPPGLHSLPY